MGIVDLQNEAEQRGFCMKFEGFLYKGNIMAKYNNFCLVCFKDKKGKLFTFYEEKKKFSTNPDCENACNEYKKGFISKICNKEINCLFDFFNAKSNKKCYHFYHYKCKPKICFFCTKYNYTVKNAVVFGKFHKYDNDFMKILYHYRFDYFKDITEVNEIQKFVNHKIKLREYAYKFIQECNEIPEEIKTIYNRKKELENKYTKKCLEEDVRDGKPFEISLNDLNEYEEKFDERLQKRNEKWERERAEERKQNSSCSNSQSSYSPQKKDSEVYVTFCSSCGNNCIFCHHEKAGTSQNRVKAHESCFEKNKRKKCVTCGKSVIGIMQPWGWFCSSCDSKGKLKYNLCYFCKEKL